jgi:hypothetical protein
MCTNLLLPIKTTVVNFHRIIAKKVFYWQLFYQERLKRRNCDTTVMGIIKTFCECKNYTIAKSDNAVTLSFVVSIELLSLSRQTQLRDMKTRKDNVI